MVFISFWLIGVALIVCQTTLMQYMPLWFGRPDFVFILVAFSAYRFAWIPGIVLVFSLGWIMDVMGGIHLGLYPLICLLTFTFLKLLASRSPVKESTYQIPLVGVAYFVAQMMYCFIYSLVLPEILQEWSWGLTLQRTILVVVSSIPLSILFNRLYEKLQRRRMRAKPLRRRPRKSE